MIADEFYYRQLFTFIKCLWTFSSKGMNRLAKTTARHTGNVDCKLNCVTVQD